MTWLTVTVYVWHKWPRICSVIRNHKTVLSLFIICHWVYKKSNTSDSMSPPPILLCDLLFSIFSFGDHCSSFCLLSVGHCIFCPSSFYVSWLPFWYLQTFSVLHINCSFADIGGFVDHHRLSLLFLSHLFWPSLFYIMDSSFLSISEFGRFWLSLWSSNLARLTRDKIMFFPALVWTIEKQSGYDRAVLVHWAIRQWTVHYIIYQ